MDDEYCSDHSEELFVSDTEEDMASDGDSDASTDMDTVDVPAASEELEQFMPTKVFTPAELEQQVTQTVADVVSFVGVTPGMARSLLNEYKWNRDLVIEKCLEREQNPFLEQCQKFAQQPKSEKKSEEGTCDVCYCDGILSGLACGHMFCEECWKEYISTKIVSDNSLDILCLATDCKSQMDEDEVAANVAKCDEKICWTFTKLVLNRFVANISSMQWCPGVDCGNVLQFTEFKIKPAKCSCGAEFCFGCTKPWHDPVNCKLLKLWEKKCSDDSETCNWMNANTRDCPKCGVAIEKNGGCNFMNCTNSTCRAPFCWTCMTLLERSHVTHSCNRFEDKEKDKECARTSLQRYLHHYNRFMNHQKSLALENQLFEKVDSKVDSIQEDIRGDSSAHMGGSVGWAERQFLKNSISTLSECRRTLMFSYAFAFYLQKDNNAMIFQDNQQDLENATEHLSKALEQDLFDEEQSFHTVQVLIREKSTYVAKRRLVLLQHVHEGDEMNSWAFST